MKLHNITKTIEFVLFLFEYVCFGEGSDWEGIKPHFRKSLADGGAYKVNMMSKMKDGLDMKLKIILHIVRVNR